MAVKLIEAAHERWHADGTPVQPPAASNQPASNAA